MCIRDSSKCDPGPGNEVSFDGNVSWTDEKEQGDGGDVLFRIFSPDEVSVAVCGEGRVVKENQNWVLRGGNEIEVCVTCPVDKNFIGMEVGGVYEFLGEWNYESNLAKGRFRLRGDAVSYTHLDVYKRQGFPWRSRSSAAP